MEIQPIGQPMASIAPPPPANEMRAAMAEQRPATTSAPAAANLTTSVSFTPAVHAQAAVFALYTQTGALAALNSFAPQPAASSTGPTDDVKPVVASSGTTVNARL